MTLPTRCACSSTDFASSHKTSHITSNEFSRKPAQQPAAFSLRVADGRFSEPSATGEYDGVTTNHPRTIGPGKLGAAGRSLRTVRELVHNAQRAANLQV